MKVVSAAQMREMDARTIADYGVAGEELMDRAGAGVAEVVRHLADAAGYEDLPVSLFAGRGNNGGDAFAAARYLKEWGERVEVWLVAESKAVRGDALKHLSAAREAGVEVHELPTRDDWDDLAASAVRFDGILVDGLLGTGLGGPARGPVAGAIRLINRQSGHGLVVAIDVPSGLDSDTGRAEGDVVIADVTATLALPKRGLVEPCAIECVGSVEVVDIGIPAELAAAVSADVELITAADLHGLLARRARGAHKGTFGHVLLVGGAAGYSGAIALAARAALRSGVGLVTVLTPECVAPIIAGLVPEAMVQAAPATEIGSLAVAGVLSRAAGGRFDAVLVGPGMTQHGQSAVLVEELLKGLRVPLVLDADALNAMGPRLEWVRAAAGPVVLTPHPGELGRLLGRTAADVQADRFAAARQTGEASGAVTVLKGAGTLVAERGRPLSVNLTGNPGMATGGAGDVLAGLIAGLLAQRLSGFDAARAGVYLHGRAGDHAAWRLSQAGLTAGDLVGELPFAFRDVWPR